MVLLGDCFLDVNEAAVTAGFEHGVGEEMLEAPSKERLVESDNLRDRPHLPVEEARSLLHHRYRLHRGTTLTPLGKNTKTSIAAIHARTDSF